MSAKKNWLISAVVGGLSGSSVAVFCDGCDPEEEPPYTVPVENPWGSPYNIGVHPNRGPWAGGQADPWADPLFGFNSDGNSFKAVEEQSNTYALYSIVIGRSWLPITDEGWATCTNGVTRPVLSGECTEDEVPGLGIICHPIPEKTLCSYEIAFDIDVYANPFYMGGRVMIIDSSGTTGLDAGASVNSSTNVSVVESANCGAEHNLMSVFAHGEHLPLPWKIAGFEFKCTPCE